ncbi:MAG: ATP-dependent sacrificial sulfur transferase LarE [Myxococcota bacterium]
MPTDRVPTLADLRERFADLESVVVALSGGVDSGLVLKLAHDTLGERVVALTAVGPAVAARELADAKALAAQVGVTHRIVSSREIEDPNYRKNPSNRCYFCKSELYRITDTVREELGFRWVVNGTNADDLGDHRPGLLAADEARVRSPLAEAGLRKVEVRQFAQRLGLPVHDKPAAPCLASRIPYGTEVTPERLQQIEDVETGLRALGFREFRVRFHGPLARIEVAEEELAAAFEARAQIVDIGRVAGFSFVSLDLQGFVSGNLNRLLPVIS